MHRHFSLGRVVRQAVLGALGAGTLGAVGAGCLDRPVVPATPTTTSRFVAADTARGVDKIDLLFMVDNSSSMADKQQILAGDATRPGAVKDLVDRLVNPKCVDDKTQTAIPAAQQPTSPTVACPSGSSREFEPIKDIHIGIITSSLGTGGADSCTSAISPYDASEQDMSHLISRTASGGTAQTYNNLGFLFWDSTGTNGGSEAYNPPGDSNLNNLETTFQEMAAGIGQVGCGFESQLEAVYRFLADPAPYANVTLDSQGAVVLNDVDQTVLDQRAGFLRPDSLLTIISLTDENDCSIRVEQGQNYYLVYQARQGTQSFRMYRPTSDCQNDPASQCCTSCALPDVNGCTPHASDPSCQQNGGQYDATDDALNLRGWHQKQRFGLSFLWPTQRYVDMVLSASINGQANPIYANLQGTNVSQTRSTEDVFWAQIIGVPWQDIAVDPTDLSKGYLTTTPNPDDTSGNDFVNRGVWNVILGDPDNFKDPIDPLMVESVDPRNGTWQVTQSALVPPGADPTAPPAVDTTKLANGHEWNVTNRDDLQYACIFDLPQPRDCSMAQSSCDCTDAITDKTQSPLCQDPATGKIGTTQYRAKAYPGIRELQVAKGLGAQGIVASICPANVKDATRADYGYRPAVGAIIDRLKSRLKAKCLPRQLQPNLCVAKTDKTYGQVPCSIVEVTPGPTDGSACPPCDSTQGRTAADPAVVASLDPAPPKGSCFCGIAQLESDNLQACQSNANPNAGTTNVYGWCYVDATAGGSADVVKKCPANEPRVIRFIGDNVPSKGATTYYACQEAAFNPSAGEDAGGTVSCQ